MSARDRFDTHGLFSETPLDEAAADAILRERIQTVFSEQLAHIRAWRPADDSPAAERALRERVACGPKGGDDDN